MKIPVSIILLFLFTNPFLKAQGQNKIVQNGYNIFYYDNGFKSSEGIMRDGKPDGGWKTYYTDGKLKSEGKRKNFELDSVWKFYDSNGFVALEIEYSHGKKNGIRRMYEDAVLMLGETFKDDIKNGKTIVYFKEGGIKKMINYEGGKEEGRAFEYSHDSLIITIIDYKNGVLIKSETMNRRDRLNRKQGVWKEFYKNGIIKSEGNYLDDKKNGFFRYYDEKGALITTAAYENGELKKDADPISDMEIITDYFPNAKVKMTGTLKKGHPDGVFRDYSEEGIITGSKIFKEGIIAGEALKGMVDKNGQKQGKWREYYPSSVLKAEGEYKDNIRQGEWIFYYENNQLEQKGRYISGKPDGGWKWFYEDGKPLREEEFKEGVEHGYLLEYSDSGTLITRGQYGYGKKEGKWIYEMGTHRETGNYKEDLRDSIWQYFYPGGRIYFEGNFILDDPDGKHSWYYPNGRIKEEGIYVAGQKDGLWKRNNEDGTIFISTLFKDGIEIKFDGTKIKPETTDME